MTQVQPSLLEEVEKKLLDHIVVGLKNNSFTAEQSETLAKQFLAILPPKDKEELLTKLGELGKEYRPAQETYAEVYSQEAEAKRQAALAAMRDHIKLGQIEQAIAVAKGGKV
jgi:hypothetical protein